MSDLQQYIDKMLSSMSLDTDEIDATHEEYDIHEEIRKLISYTRTTMGLTQKELAFLSGMTQANISKIENGNALPSIATLKKIADSLGKRLVIDFVEKEGIE